MEKGESKGLEICKKIRFEFKEETVFDSEVWVHTPYLDEPFRLMYGDMVSYGGTKVSKSIRIASNVLPYIMDTAPSEPSELMREFKIKFGQTPLSFLNTLKRANFKAAIESVDKDFEYWSKKLCYDRNSYRNLLKMKWLYKNWDLRKDLPEECYPLLLLNPKIIESELHRGIMEGRSFTRNKVVADFMRRSFLLREEDVTRLGTCSKRSLELGMEWNIPLEMSNMIVENNLGGEFDRLMSSFNFRPFVGGFGGAIDLVCPELSGTKGKKLEKLLKSILAQCTLMGMNTMISGMKQLVEVQSYKNLMGNLDKVVVSGNPFKEGVHLEF